MSSHLLSEMALTADQLIVIGKGRLVAETSTYEFVKQHSASATVVRSDDMVALAAALRGEEIDFVEETDEEGRATYVVADQTTDLVGKVAYSYGVPLTELALRRASLEEAFMALTGDLAQYKGNAAGTPAAAPEMSAALIDAAPGAAPLTEHGKHAADGKDA